MKVFSTLHRSTALFKRLPSTQLIYSSQRMFHKPTDSHKTTTLYDDNSGFKEFLNSQTVHTDPQEDTATTPFDKEYDLVSERKFTINFHSLGMPEEEQSLVLGLTQFEEAIKLINEKKLTEAEAYLKEALGVLKKAQ